MWDLEKLKGMAGKGKVSRRDFIQFALATGVTVAAAETMFVNAVQAAPKKGGSFKMALGHGATTDSLDPATYPDQFTGTVGWGSIGNSLTEVDYKGDIQLDLAESMDHSDDAKTWMFKLRKGATFHNGKTVTSTDVVESFRWHMGKDSKSAAKSLLKDVTDIKADGPETTVFTLTSGSADFPYIASDYHIPIMPAKDGGGVDWQSGIRTGPYMLEKFEPGVSAKMKRNPNYYGKAWFDDVEVLSIIDVNARTNALTNGEVHYIDRCDLKTLSLLKRQPGIKIWEGTGYGHYVLPMLTNVAPFDNVDVRTALKYAVDREDILKKVFLGHGKVGNDNPIAPGIKYEIDPTPKFAYDPEKAKFHLKKAGLSSLKVDLSASDAAFAGAVDAAVLYQQHAKAAGIDINVVREPNDGYWDNVWMKKPWCASYWNGRPTIDWMFTTAYAADASWNDTNWKNPKFNELLIQARSETDTKKRATMYSEMQELLHNDGGIMVLMFNSYVSAYSNKLGHEAHVAANWDDDGMKLTSRWWFA
jgi:peptide/nickel transport system substrate-binding protein